MEEAPDLGIRRLTARTTELGMEEAPEVGMEEAPDVGIEISHSASMVIVSLILSSSR